MPIAVFLQPLYLVLLRRFYLARCPLTVRSILVVSPPLWHSWFDECAQSFVNSATTYYRGFTPRAPYRGASPSNSL